MNRKNNVPSATYYFLAIIFLLSGINNFTKGKTKEGVACVVIMGVYLLLIYMLKGRRDKL